MYIVIGVVVAAHLMFVRVMYMRERAIVAGLMREYLTLGDGKKVNAKVYVGYLERAIKWLLTFGIARRIDVFGWFERRDDAHSKYANARDKFWAFIMEEFDRVNNELE